MDKRSMEQPENVQPEGEAQGGARPEGEDIARELNQLAEAFARAASAAWNSDQRRQLEIDLRRGLTALVDGVEEALVKFNQSEQGQELREQAEKVVEQVRTSKIAADLKEGLAKGLQTTASEVQNFADKLEQEQQATAPDVQDIPVEQADAADDSDGG